MFQSLWYNDLIHKAWMFKEDLEQWYLCNSKMYEDFEDNNLIRISNCTWKLWDIEICTILNVLELLVQCIQYNASMYWDPWDKEIYDFECSQTPGTIIWCRASMSTEALGYWDLYHSKYTITSRTMNPIERFNVLRPLGQEDLWLWMFQDGLVQWFDVGLQCPRKLWDIEVCTILNLPSSSGTLKTHYAFKKSS
jgi:hypothetical protein